MECERSLSFSRKLKIYTLGLMVTEVLNNLALVHFHMDIIVNIEKVIDFMP